MVSRAKSSATSRGTQSEGLFESYLAQVGAEWEYERGQGQKKPDYTVTWRGGKLICEVKELRQKRPKPNGPVHFNPYAGIRKKIEKARRQFKEYRDFTCVLVLHNVDDWEFRDWPWALYGAMLGDLGMQAPFDGQSVDFSQSRSAFLKGGQMVAPRTRDAQNTTISAVGVLSEVTVPNPEFRERYARAVWPLAGDLQRLEIYRRLSNEVPATLGRKPRISLFENPVARIRVPEALFKGAYDTRHRLCERRIQCVYAGHGVASAAQDVDLLESVKRFTDALVETFKPDKVILFGSHAQDCAAPDSDVDLLVIFPDSAGAVDRELEIRKRLIPSFPLDLVVRSTGEVQRRLDLGDPFLREAIDDGIVLYEAADA